MARENDDLKTSRIHLPLNPIWCEINKQNYIFYVTPLLYGGLKMHTKHDWDKPKLELGHVRTRPRRVETTPQNCVEGQESFNIRMYISRTKRSGIPKMRSNSSLYRARDGRCASGWVVPWDYPFGLGCSNPQWHPFGTRIGLPGESQSNLGLCPTPKMRRSSSLYRVREPHLG